MTPKGSKGISNLVERQMRNWELARSQKLRAEAEADQEKHVKFYVAISRESGCGAAEISEKLVERTGFSMFDKEILDYMVDRDEVRRRLYETLDDHTVGWIEDICSSLTFGPAADGVEYFNRLNRALLAICLHAHAIIIGRGANFVLPRESGLAVRLVATKSYRLETYMTRTGMSLKEAEEEMDRIDRRRSQFIENHFGKYAYDPRRYDLVINVSEFSSDTVADIIVSGIRAKAGEGLRLPVTKQR